MKPFTRADRVGGLIQKALSDILYRRIKGILALKGQRSRV